jgi:hypothetical protein
MLGQSKLGRRWLMGLTLLTLGIVLAAVFLPRLVSGNGSDNTTIARGGGTTIIHGGTGSPGFVPVIATIAFHAKRNGNNVTVSIDSPKRVPKFGKGISELQKDSRVATARRPGKGIR